MRLRDKEVPGLGWVDDTDSDLITSMDRFLLKNLGVPEADAAKFLQQKYPDIEAKALDGNIFLRPKNSNSGVWQPLDSPQVTMADIGDVASDVGEGLVDASLSLVGPAGVGAAVGVSGAANALRQKIARDLGMQEGNRLGETVATGLGAGVIPGGALAVKKFGPKLASKVSKNIPESVWKTFYDKMDTVKGYMKNPRSEEFAKNLADSLSSTWRGAGEQIDKAKGMASELPANTSNLILELRNRIKEGLTPDLRGVTPLKGKEKGFIPDVELSLAKKTAKFPSENVEGLISRNRKVRSKLPEAVEAKDMKEAENAWMKIAKDIDAKRAADLIGESGVNPISVAPIVDEAGNLNYFKGSYLDPNIKGKDLINFLESNKGLAKFNDDSLGGTGKQIMSTALGKSKDLLKGTSKDVASTWNEAAAKLADLETVPNKLFGVQRVVKGAEDDAMTGAKEFVKELVPDTEKAIRYKQNLFTGPEELAAEKLAQARRINELAPVPNFEEQVAATAMNNPKLGMMGTVQEVAGDVAGGLGSQAAYATKNSLPGAVSTYRILDNLVRTGVGPSGAKGILSGAKFLEEGAAAKGFEGMRNRYLQTNPWDLGVIMDLYEMNKDNNRKRME